MKAHIGKNVLGAFAFDDDGNLLSYKAFSNDPKEVIELLGRESEQEKELVKELKDQDFDVSIDKKGDKLAKKKVRSLAKDLNVKPGELNKLISKVSRERTKKSVKKSVKKDKVIMNAVNSIDDFSKILNLMSERLREWFSLHYPELEVKDHKRYAELIAEHGSRDNFPDFKESMGIDLEDNDIEVVRNYAERLYNLYNLKEEISEYIKKSMKEEAPNISMIVDPILGARLIEQAGSLKKLAKMPSSTIQILGAEKALFRHMKGQGKSPKHGVIFTDSRISEAPGDKRGKIARLISAKLALAARADAYGDRIIADDLNKDLEEKLEEV